MQPETLGAAAVGDIVDLSHCVGWDYAPAEIATALASGTMLGIRGVNDLLLACAGIFPYPEMASLGMVMVLAATEAGQPLYEQLGFRT